MYRKEPFIQWVQQNYPGVFMDNFPKDWDPKKHVYIKIEERQHRVPLKDIPKRFLTDEEWEAINKG